MMPHQVNMAQEKWVPGQTVIANYNFSARSREDLPFSKGEVLKIVRSTRDPNWYKAQNVMRKEGMIPANYVARHTLGSPQPLQSQQPQQQQPPPLSQPFPPLQAQRLPHQPHHNQNSVITMGENRLFPLTTPVLQPAAPQGLHKEIAQQSMPWYHGMISREQAEDLLCPREDGLFLIRESSNYPGDYTLCVAFQSKVEHYHIKCLRNQLTIDDEVFFDTLVKLVVHYENDADGLCTRLVRSVPKKGTHDVAVDVHDFEKGGWALSMQDLVIGESLGKGEFGEVYKGTYKNEAVAVKQLKDTTTRGSQTFLKEASVMTSVHHANLVRLIGVVITDTIFLVTEFMARGNLVDYLRSRGRSVITKKHQIDFASDTCAAMAYVESRNLVHRDLAARNVLVNDDGIAKVSDFGLARHEGVNLDGGKFPIKWTAPEALRESKFTNKSDMWSFGILLWEIYSFGRVPYPRIPLADVVMHVERGYRMEAPEACPAEIYTIMVKSWDIDPNKRPTFKEVHRELEQLRTVTT